MDARPVVEAVVVTGGVETPYRRAGRGATVLLLGAGGLFDELTETLRVVEPLRLPGGPAGTAESDERGWRDWLRGLVDGLGVDRPALVVDIGLEAMVLRAVHGDPDRFGPVVPAGTAAEVRAALMVRDEIIDA